MTGGGSQMEDGGWRWRTMTETSDRYVIEFYNLINLFYFFKIILIIFIFKVIIILNLTEVRGKSCHDKLMTSLTRNSHSNVPFSSHPLHTQLSSSTLRTYCAHRSL